YGPVSHAHADQNAFTLEAFGDELAIASGYYPWYNSDHHSQWQWESKSSNTITFNNGVGQVKRDARSAGRIVHFIHTDAFDYVEADAAQAYQGRLKECVRQVVHVRPGAFVMLDRVAAPEPVTFEWRLHANAPIVMNGNGWLVSRQKATLEVSFHSPADLKFSLHEGAEPPPEREAPVQYYALASTAEPTPAANYLSVLVPKRRNGTPKVSITPLSVKGGAGLRVAVDGVESLVAFNTSGRILELAGVTTQGPVLAVRLDDSGKPIAHLCVEQVQ
nr:heparinase II/III family protein [bacterium]